LIKHWLDQDIAVVISALYYYAWATIFAQEMISAAKLVKYWDLGSAMPPLIFFFLVPGSLVCINLLSVNVRDASRPVVNV
jgi:amino acid permease